MNDSNFTEHFIYGNSIKLHYLDWGGHGEPLILIHGLGDSPYLFEDLADSLKNHFRVIAYSKRGHCRSETSDSTYDTPALVSDLKLLLDSLKIPKANLLGWSMGGNEITEFAIQYPERVHKLIYFEAGYDLSEEPFKIMLESLSRYVIPDSSNLMSLDEYRKWYHHYWFPDVDWNPTLEQNLLAGTLVRPDSSIQTLPNNEIFRTTLRAAMRYHRQYEKVNAPALVLFTNYFFHAPESDSSVVKIFNTLEQDLVSPWRQHSMSRIKTEFKNATIKTISKGSHVSFIFLGKEEIVQAINTFLLE